MVEIRLLIIIVTYNSEKWIRKNLASIGSEADILVLDNGSTDNTVTIIRREFPNVRLIENEDNLGFAAANNIGFEIATKKNYDWVFLVNHDGWLEEGCIAEMIKVMHNTEYKEYGILSPVHFAGDEKSYDFGFKRFCNIKDLQLKKAQGVDLLEVDEINGAFMMLRMKCIKVVRGFDPVFYFYGEDIDLCQRAKKNGFKIGVVIKALSYHDRAERPLTNERLFLHIIANHLIQIKSMSDSSFLIRFVKAIFSAFFLSGGDFLHGRFRRSYLYVKLVPYLLNKKKEIKSAVQNY